ncbi:dipeptidase [Pseudonocardia sp. KRD-184]|uniref:Dipeptidase n=1 Tax=Pseudonocardia oceani TaxID=2792013 RepID=A0ABS6UDC9_9PSEU|nr:dipeptidase [Pseudonocardia oceani]MBW0093174.1 dipeptidase [Pseudonocardia oceani]MBW0099961.1 dipeptidase [Pseudonocardia oceani]MBW0112577.1 dipeptidase [Pseudonocardia oceani]MBW0120208.1 dipeptidase [Pseudonocardia oceani]MBW0130252.1 dipeptidase [Pseudonocardia oceani]
MSSREALLRAVRGELDRALVDLEQLIRIPSVWSDPAHRLDTHTSADAVAAMARDAGARTVQIIQASGGAPSVLAQWPAPAGQPTILLYAHHDVQPAGSHRIWTSPPFEPTIRDGRLYGRGAADDKAGIMTHLSVLRAYSGKPPIGVTLFVEGEEESGSPTLRDLMISHQSLFTADAAVVADGSNPATDTPALTTSLRGLVNCVVEIEVLDQAVHSGMAGGVAPDALTALCRMLGSLHDDRGRVAVRGLLVDCVGTDPRSADADTEHDFRSNYGVLDGVELIGCGSINDRLWYGPAATVLGIDAPSVDEAANVLVPRARALVSLRTAPGRDSHSAYRELSEHLQANAPWGARVRTDPRSIGSPSIIRPSGTTYDIARNALSEAFGSVVHEVGMGGSIPFVAEFSSMFPAAPLLITGVGDPASRWHGIDESLDMKMFTRGILAEALLLNDLAQE